MAIDKPSLNDFLPNGFETQDKTGWKQNFDSDKISTGFDKDTLEVLSGPNLNSLLDNVGKNTHTLQQFLNFFRDMPIGSFPVVNTSNQLDYKSVNSFFRNVGEIVFSAIPLEDGNLRLLDGSLLEYTMTYSRFITYIAGYRTSLPNLFCTQAEFDQSVATYGVCGKFVYDTETKSLRLPKISGFIKGTLDSGSLGDVDEAKAPNITGSATISGAFVNSGEGAIWGTGRSTNRDDDLDNKGTYEFHFDASRCSNVYKDGATTIEPQAIKEFIYMVVSIDEAEKQVLSAVYNYKGSVENYSDLPTAVAIGEVYNVIGEDPEGYSGANFAWTGEEWDRLGGTVNLSGYLTKTEAQNTYATKASLESNVDYLQGQINTNASNIANIASQEVIDAGIQKIEMLKFASTLGAGKVADTDLYSVIKKYKYSSFDVNKFTKVGTPNITKDGIASGFSSSNYLKENISFSNPSTLEVHYKFKTPANIPSASESLFLWNVATGNRVFSTFDVNKSCNFCWGTSLRTVTGTLDLNTEYEFISKFENSKIVTKYRKITETSYTTTSEVTVSENLNGNADLNIGIFTTSSPLAFNGSIDLKQFSITVDGVEVFSGNKTGIDTIKPDAYTTTATPPTISADGIASNFTSSNYIKVPKEILNNVGTNSWSIEVEGVCNNYGTFAPVFSGGGHVWNDTASFFNVGRLNTANTWISYIILNDNGVPVNTYIGSSDTLQTSIVGQNYKLTLGYDNSTSKYYSKTEFANGVKAEKEVQSNLYLAQQTDDLYVGYNYGDYAINLNALKIYIAGDLVYQPCLKIPYTESKTGLKITDKLDRAIDMAKQCGFSQYFGLDEQNGLCLVPQGDNITGRRELISRVEDSVTHYVTEIYSDLYCRQMGSGTASTAVTLDIPFKDANYKLSVPQSAKSKTGFTPTASCDWTAEGYIYLDEVI